MATPTFQLNTNNLSGTNTVQAMYNGTQYVKTVQQDSNGNWVQIVLQLTQGALIPILKTVFPYGVKPNLYDSVQLGNGQVLGQFSPYGGNTGGGTDNTMLLVLLVVGILLFLPRKRKD